MGCTYEFMGKLYTKEQLIKLLQDKGIQNKIKVLENKIQVENDKSFSPDEETSFEFTEEDFVPFDDIQSNENSDFNSTNINVNTDTDMVLEYDKLVKFKQNLLNTLKNRIANLKSFINSLTDANKIKENTKLLEELTQRADELDQEIYNEKNAGESSLQKLKFQAERDFERVKKLLSPNQEMTDTYENLKEAKKIINFYKSLEVKTDKMDLNKNPFKFHPFFNVEELFGNNGKPILSPEIVEIFNKLAEQFNPLEEVYHARQKELLTTVINANPKVKTILGGKSYDEIMANLGDATWLDMMIMEANRGVFSKNGLIPQVSLEIIQDNETESISKHKSFEEKHNELLPKVKKALQRLNKGLLGRLKNVSYEIFFQQVLPGKTGIKLVNRFSQDYFDKLSNVIYKFKESVKRAKALAPSELDETGDETRKKAITNAYNEKQKWFRENTMMLDIRKLPEIAMLFPEFELEYEDDGGQHKAELIEQIGQIGYVEELKKQIDQLRKYTAWRNALQETFLEHKNVSSISELNEEQINELKLAIAENNPFNAVSYFYDNDKLKIGKEYVNNTMNYNTTIPRKYAAKTSFNKEGKLSIVSTDEQTGFYDDNYQTIESDPDLKAYYDLISSRMEQVSNIFPEEIRKNLFTGSLPLLRRTVAEIFSDPNIPILKRISKALYQIYENIKLGFGVNENDSIYQDTEDSIVDKADPKVNASFLNNNKKAITDRYSIVEKKLNNELRKAGIPLKINKYTEILTDALPYPVTKLLAEKLGITASTNALKAKFGDKIKVGDVLYKLTISEIAQESSLDLSKIIKYFSIMGAEYEARQKSLPLISMLKDHYEQIKTDKGGPRTRANTQFESWFNRVVLGTSEQDKFGVEKESTLEEKTTIKEKMKAAVKGRILSSEEEKRKKEINELLKDIEEQVIKLLSDKTVDNSVKIAQLQKEQTELLKQREQLGKRRSTSAAYDSLLNYIRFLGLGYKLSSMVTNFMEGQIANMNIAASGDYFEPGHLYRALRISQGSIIKNSTGGKFSTNGARKLRTIVDRFDILQDSSNELQKASQKTAFSYLDNISPYVGNKRVEYLNQTPLIIAVMLNTEITGKNGKKSNVWDALNTDGILKPEFKTKENIQAWEEGSGAIAQEFKKNVSNAIVSAHGNYDRLRGIMAKESAIGKTMMMFKTWFGSALYQRFAIQQDDLSSNAKGFKGRYLSHTKGSALLQGAMIGGVFAGFPGAVIGGGVGWAIAAYKAKAISEIEERNGALLGSLKEALFLFKSLVRKSLGFPINLVAGNEIIKEYSNYEKLQGGKFTERDVKNMRGLITEMSFILSTIGLGLLVKQLLWDDDDEEDSLRRMTHNVLMNYINQIQASTTGYLLVPTTVESFLGRIAPMEYVSKVGKFVTEFGEYLEGNEISVAGSNQGEIKALETLKKITLPAIVTQDVLGFETLAERQFSPTYYDDWFWDDEKKARNTVQQQRVVLKKQLEEEGVLTEKQIDKILNEHLKLPKDIKDPTSRTTTVEPKKPKEKITEEQKRKIKELKEILGKKNKEEQQEEEEK